MRANTNLKSFQGLISNKCESLYMNEDWITIENYILHHQNYSGEHQFYESSIFDSKKFELRVSLQI